MTNEDYQLEELENAAVKKSNNAKRIAAAAGFFVAGGAAGYAATQVPVGEEETQLPELDNDDSGANAGANQIHEPEPKPVPQPKAPEPVNNEPEVSFDKTTHYYDENNNLVMTTEEGTVNGQQFKLVDVDGDMRADILAYDADGNGVINEDEIVELSGKDQIAMGHATAEHDDQFIALHEPEPYPEPYDIDEEKDYADNNIHNDFEDEKTGETYSHDYAENNEDYDNGEVEHYSAETSDGSDYAYEDEVKDESDYEYNDFAENDTTDDTFDDLGSDSLDIV